MPRGQAASTTRLVEALDHHMDEMPLPTLDDSGRGEALRPGVAVAAMASVVKVAP